MLPPTQTYSNLFTKGYAMKVSFALLLALLLAAPQVVTSDEIDLDSLFTLSIGGSEALKTVTEMTSIQYVGHGTLSGAPMTGRSVYLAPDKYRMDVKLGPTTMVVGFDGETAWKQDHNGYFSEASGQERQDILRAAFFESYSHMIKGRFPGERAYIESLALDDTTFHVVDFYLQGTDTVRTVWEASSGLLRSTKMTSDGHDMYTDVGDYRLVSDVMISHYSYSEIEGTPLTAKMQVDSVTFNVPVDESIFFMSSSQPADFRLPPGEDSVRVQFVYQNGHIYVRGVINGSTNVWFILDSGASANMINRPAVKRLDLPVIGFLPAKGIGGYDRARLIKIDSLCISGLCLLGQVAGVLDLSAFGEGKPDGDMFGGILGHDFLSRFPMMLSFVDSTLTVYNPDSFEPPIGGEAIPFRRVMNVPVVAAEIGGIQGDFLVDLGNAFGLVVHEEFVLAHNFEEHLTEIESGKNYVHGIGGKLKCRTARAEQLKLGSLIIESPEVILPSGGVGVTQSANLAGNIGTPILDNFDVLLDYASNTIILYPPE